MILLRNEANRKMLENQERAGKLKRLSPGIYSSDLHTDPEMQIRANLARILGYLRPGCTISHRSALKNDFGASDGVVVITDPTAHNNYIHELPGLKVLATPGAGPLPSDSNLGGVYVSSVARAILENLEPRRPIKDIGMPKQASESEVKEAIRRTSSQGLAAGAKFANRESSGKWMSEEAALSKIIEKNRMGDESRPLHLSTHIDHARVAMFENLATQLLRNMHGNEQFHGDKLQSFPSRPSIGDDRFLNLAFFESYFSNYIEGTEFTPEDAYDIALDERAAGGQSRDGHDIRSLYRLYSTPSIFLREDRTADEFMDNLKYWHSIFGAHKDKESIRPGQFKDKANRAGSTWFTDPSQVDGTLKASWEIGQSLKEPFDLAVFRAVSTVSVHPFLDGNGRITRLAASNVLGRSGKSRMMIPTVFREDYILAMQAFSGGDPVPSIRMFRRAMEITTSIPFDKDFKNLVSWLKERNAFSDSHEGKWTETSASNEEDKAAPSSFAPK